jgi:hypothetical protein
MKRSHIFRGCSNGDGLFSELRNICQSRGCRGVAEMGLPVQLMNMSVRGFIESMSPCPGVPFSELLGTDVPERTIELLDRLLALNPRERGTTRSLLQLPFFSEVNGLYDESIAPVEAASRCDLQVQEEATSLPRQMMRRRFGGLHRGTRSWYVDYDDNSVGRSTHARDVLLEILHDEVNNNGVNEVRVRVAPRKMNYNSILLSKVG